MMLIVDAGTEDPPVLPIHRALVQRLLQSETARGATVLPMTTEQTGAPSTPNRR